MQYTTPSYPSTDKSSTHWHKKRGLIKDTSHRNESSDYFNYVESFSSSDLLSSSKSDELEKNKNLKSDNYWKKRGFSDHRKSLSGKHSSDKNRMTSSAQASIHSSNSSLPRREPVVEEVIDALDIMPIESGSSHSSTSANIFNIRHHTFFGQNEPINIKKSSSQLQKHHRYQPSMPFPSAGRLLLDSPDTSLNIPREERKKCNKKKRNQDYDLKTPSYLESSQTLRTDISSKILSSLASNQRHPKVITHRAYPPENPFAVENHHSLHVLIRFALVLISVVYSMSVVLYIVTKSLSCSQQTSLQVLWLFIVCLLISMIVIMSVSAFLTAFIMFITFRLQKAIALLNVDQL